MDKMYCAHDLPYGNILYIGDNGRECLTIIEKFTRSLRKIENNYANLLKLTYPNLHHPLQRCIQFHFEGGIAIFRFKDENQIPLEVRNECLVACQSLAFEQLVNASQVNFSLN